MNGDESRVLLIVVEVESWLRLIGKDSPEAVAEWLLTSDGEYPAPVDVLRCEWVDEPR